MKSMTGYGAHEATVDGCRTSVQIRSVNNRFLEISPRLPHLLSGYEPALRERIEACVARGKIDLVIETDFRDVRCAISIDESLVTEYASAYRRVARLAGVGETVTPDAVVAAAMRADGAITIRKDVDAAAIWRGLLPCFEKALQQFEKTRLHDGRETGRDLARLLKSIENAMKTVRARTKNSVTDYRRELEKRLVAMVGQRVDEARILAEAAVLASRSDVNEELRRLESHIALFRQHLAAEEPAGKTLDFIAQEMHREINTIGSKQDDAEIAARVIGMKSDLEKIREQVRNVE